MKQLARLMLFLALLPESSPAQSAFSNCIAARQNGSSITWAMLAGADAKTGRNQAWEVFAMPEADDQLEIVGEHWDGLRNLMLLRVRKQDSNAPPFFLWRRCTAECAAQLGCDSTRASTGAKATRRLSPMVLVRPGRSTTLLLEQSGLRIVLQAVALDRGSKGDAVRVRTRAGSRLFTGKVIGPGMVAAQLPGSAGRMP